MTCKLVPMNRSHLAEVAAIERACFSAPWSEEMLAEELRHENASYLVAEGERGAVLGYAGLQAVLDEGYITNIAVAPAYRRRGVADALVDALCPVRRGASGFPDPGGARFQSGGHCPVSKARVFSRGTAEKLLRSSRRGCYFDDIGVLKHGTGTKSSDQDPD